MTFFRRFLALFSRSRMDRDMDAEMRAHLERETAQNIARGLSPDEARQAARRAFGGLDQLKEHERDARGWQWFENVWRDVRFAVRSLVKSPGFTCVAILTLALGIGAGTAVFSLVHAVLLRSLPVPNPQELRVLQWTGTEARMHSITGYYHEVGNRVTAESVSAPMFLNLREQARANEIADVFGFHPLDEVIVRARQQAFAANGMVVSDNFFSGLGVQPFIGQLFAPGNEPAGLAHQVVITYDWWEKQFAHDPEILGQTIKLNHADFTIIGVLPRGFSGIRPGEPCNYYTAITPGSPFLDDAITSSRHWWVRMMARLKPGATDAKLKATLDVVFPREADALMDEPGMLIQPGRGGLAFDRDLYRRPLSLMLGIVGVVMLVVCANIAGLSLARGAARQHELAIRAAMGARRWRLVRQSLTESLVLAMFGGGLGVIIAIWGRSAISRLLAGEMDGLHYDLSLNVAVLGFSLAAVFVAALLSGLLPALRAGLTNPQDSLKTRGTLAAPRLLSGRVLVCAQICLSMLLLFGAGLYVRSLIQLTHIDAGFNTDRLLLFELNPRGAGYSREACVEYHERILDTLTALPGVSNACLANYHLLDNQRSWGTFTLSGQRAASQPELRTHRLRVSETFFDTMNIPLLRGRALRKTDVHAVVVNESFVQQFSPDRDPIGLTMYMWDAEWQIVGICADAKYDNIKAAVPATTYFSYRGRVPYYSPSFAIRTGLPAMTLAAAVRQAVAAINPDIPVTGMRTQEQLRAGNISQERLFAMLCGALAGLALLLCCIGLYGLMAYNVARRTGEIGIRMALGATRREIARPILREALMLGGIGIAIGLPMALALSRIVTSQLYGIEPNDPLTFAAVVLLLLFVAMLAAWLPARRAARVDPIVALRAE